MHSEGVNSSSSSKDSGLYLDSNMIVNLGLLVSENVKLLMYLIVTALSPVLLALAFLSMAVNSSAEIFLSLELTVSCIRCALIAEFRMFSSELDLLAVSNFWMTCQK